MSKYTYRKPRTASEPTARTTSRLDRFKPSRAQLVSGALIFSASVLAFAVIPTLTQFAPNTTISASAVNGNFNTLATALDTRIAALETKLASVSIVPSSGVPAVPTVLFTGVNVQVVNGAGKTDSANGAGNLIVGYDEPDTSVVSRCSIGNLPTTGRACTTAGGTISTTGFKNGSHYVVTGSQNNYSRWGGLLTGFQNSSLNDYASVTGGNANTASGPYASVSGGGTNTASGSSASISGGSTNVASGAWASVSGGGPNSAIGIGASVSGGTANTAGNTSGSISGGNGCTNAVVNGWAVGGLAAGCSLLPGSGGLSSLTNM